MRSALIALSATAALTAGSLGTAQAAEPDGTAAGATQEVTYRGHTFSVPETWKVIDLKKEPDTCVRFDRNAVYLGTPGAEQDCPAQAFGRTEALLVEPAKATETAKAARVTESSAAHTYQATADRISVTAAYGDDRKGIEDVLRSASLPVDAVKEAAAAEQPSVKAVPGDATTFTGHGFDRCSAPSTDQMNAWQDESPYSAVGVYIGGINSGCEPNIDAQWVQAQYENDWRFFPLYVGPQAAADAGSCTGDCQVIADPVPEGAEAARDAVAQAKSLGLGEGSAIYYNMENYEPGPDTTSLAMPFLESWTTTLHELGYVSAVYGGVYSMIADLVASDGSNYLLPDVVDFPRWCEQGGQDLECSEEEKNSTADPDIPDHMWADGQRVKQYSGDVTESYGGVELAIDGNYLDVGEGGGEPEPPVQKDTALEYTGPKTVANGSPVELSATLTEKEGAAPVAERPVSISLGAEDTAQTCEGTTNADGAATCTVDAVKQPLNDDATVPVTATFAGDEEFKKSEVAAEVKLQYVTGRAYGLSADAPLLGLPLAIKPTPDTGEVRTADAETKKPDCAQNINVLVLSAQALCAEVAAKTGPSSVTSTASVAEVNLGLPGLPVIGVSGVKSASTSSCTDTTGSTDLDLTVAGTPVEVGDVPNFAVDLGAGAKLVVNEQVETENGLTVNAVHLTAAGGVDVVIASSTTAAANCA